MRLRTLLFILLALVVPGGLLLWVAGQAWRLYRKHRRT